MVLQSGKVCTKCNQFKNLTEYYKNGKYHKSSCKECCKQKSQQYRDHNPDKVKDYNKKKYEENREAERVRRKKRYEKNKEKALEYCVSYRRRNGVNEKFLWTEELFLERLKAFVEESENLNATYVCRYHHYLYRQSYKFFGGWKQALEHLGINYEEIQVDFETAKAKGTTFEQLLDDIVTDLQIEFTKGFTKEIRPDYIFPNNIWGDAKLSEWSIHHCDTVSKYEPYCSMLFIIFMRGDVDKDEMLTNKTRIISVHKLIKQLSKEKRKLYTSKIQEIENDLLLIEKNQTTA